MKRYVAFLRGINISGKNKVPMSGLKTGFEELGFVGPVTYLNSGNIAFSADTGSTAELTATVERMLAHRFAAEIPVFVIGQAELRDILAHAPEWWGNTDKEIYDNLVFLMPPLTYEDFRNEVGEPGTGLETAYNYKDAVFWSFSRKDYQKTNWWAKTADCTISRRITIRTANTVRRAALL